MGLDPAPRQSDPPPATARAVRSTGTFRRKGNRARARMALVSAAEEQEGGVAEGETGLVGFSFVLSTHDLFFCF